MGIEALRSSRIDSRRHIKINLPVLDTAVAVIGCRVGQRIDFAVRSTRLRTPVHVVARYG